MLWLVPRKGWLCARARVHFGGALPGKVMLFLWGDVCNVCTTGMPRHSCWVFCLLACLLFVCTPSVGVFDSNDGLCVPFAICLHFHACILCRVLHRARITQIKSQSNASHEEMTPVLTHALRDNNDDEEMT